MTTDYAIDPATLQAYRETDYRVFAAEPFVLRVGVRCPELGLHARCQATSSVFVTAHNPRGKILEAAANEHRQAALLQEISRRGWTAVQGVGQHPTGKWPGEPSQLVLGPSCKEAQALGRQFEQNTVIWTGANGVPELVLCYLDDL